MKRSDRSASLVLLGLLAALAVGGFASSAWLSSRPSVPLDPSGCPTEGPAPAHTILLIDATDRFSAAQARRLVEVAQIEARDLPRHGRMTVALIAPDAPWEPAQVLSICSPGRGAEADPLVDTATVVEGTWRRRFLEPLRSAAGRLTGLPEADESPVLQSLIGLAARRDFGPGASQRRLIYIGDGLQHTAGGYSHYAGGDVLAAYEGSDLARETTADFSRVTVEIEYLRRPGAAAHQGAAHRDFWIAWFTRRGASEVTLRR